MFVIINFLIYPVIIYFIHKNFRFNKNLIFSYAVLISGSLLLIAIFLGTHRLWGFYLYPGFVLILLGVILITEAVVQDQDFLYNFKFILILSKIVSISILLIALIYWLPKNVESLINYSNREKNKIYLEEIHSYNKAVAFLKTQSPSNGRLLRVMYTPSLFLPESGDFYKIIDFTGPYKWNENQDDILILGISNTPRGHSYAPDSPEYKEHLAERSGYFDHVASVHGVCLKSPCFKRVMLLDNGAEILVKQN